LTEADRARLRPQVVAIARKGDILRSELLAKLDAALHPSDGSAPAISRGRILVVDDHDLNRELVRSILERRGYEVLQAEDGEVGVALAQKARPDVILMDLTMPRKDGFAATRELKAALDTRSIPIVALTALAMRGDEEKAVAAGVDGYLTKPVDRKRLEETVERLMSGRRAS
jgi:two-component system, cell cycle response regulator DivK